MSSVEWDILVNPVIGGVIGYATNYLAIKMLFRPHEAKYIGKIKIPFTPGLIPKEKAALAKQMGEITEAHLLTEDMLVETLTSPKVKDVFLKFMDNLSANMEESDQTISDVAKDILGDNIKTPSEIIIAQFSAEIITMLKSKEVMDLAVPYISNTLSAAARDQIAKGINDNSISQYIKELGLNSLENETTKDYIYKAIDDLEEKIYHLLQENAAIIGEGILGAIGEGEEADKIKVTLQHWIDENFNPMVSMFIKVDKIYEGIIHFAREALEDPERNQKFGQLLCTIVKGIAESDLDYKDKAIDIIREQIKEENIAVLIGIIVEELREKEISAQVQIEKWIYTQWEQSINTEDFLALIKKTLKKIMEAIGQNTLANLNAIIPNNIKTQINERVFSYYVKVIASNSANVADVMDISHLVESKINEFSSEEAESLILSVVKTQLRGITWIGALLGTLIGIVSNFIS